MRPYITISMRMYPSQFRILPGVANMTGYCRASHTTRCSIYKFPNSYIRASGKHAWGRASDGAEALAVEDAHDAAGLAAEAFRRTELAAASPTARGTSFVPSKPTTPLLHFGSGSTISVL